MLPVNEGQIIINGEGIIVEVSDRAGSTAGCKFTGT
jgi:hypothetical protein